MTTQKAKRRVSVLDRESLLAFGEHLTGEGRARFCLAATGRVHVGRIEVEVRALRAAGPVAIAAVPNDVAARVDLHTAQGAALWYQLLALQMNPALGDEVNAAATRVREALGTKAPNPRTLAATRVAQASALRARLEGLQPDLAALPAPHGGESFAARIHDWCERAGQLAEDLVREAVARAEAAPDTSPGPTRAVRQLHALLARARAALRDEVASDATLPRTLEAEAFGLYDQLREARRRRRRPARKKAVKAPASPTPA
jgi:hypothetical protein